MPIQIEVKLKGVPEAVQKLKSIPGGSDFALRQSILYSLRRGRTFATRAARDRYTVPYSWMLRAIGQPRMSGGLTGYLRVSGYKAPLSIFPHTDDWPHGLRVEELKAKPFTLLHAFARTGKIFERETPQTKRLPIRQMTGLGPAQMIGQRTEVWPKLQASLEKDVHAQLERLIQLVLAGQIVPR